MQVVLGAITVLLVTATSAGKISGPQPLYTTNTIWVSSCLLVSVKIYLREGFKVRKKKSVENSTLGSETPPPSVEKYNLFFLSFWQHSEQLWKKLFFPLEKTQKHLENFHKSFLVEG